MSERAQALGVSGGIHDFHCYVVWQGSEREVKLDATWPDRMAPLGYSGERRMGRYRRHALRSASDPLSKARAEDVLDVRRRCSATSQREEQINDRLRFLKLLTEWMPSIGREWEE